MSKNDMRARITFGLTVLVIGYNFLPIKPDDSLRWGAAIICLIIGVAIFLDIPSPKPK